LCGAGAFRLLLGTPCALLQRRDAAMPTAPLIEPATEHARGLSDKADLTIVHHMRPAEEGAPARFEEEISTEGSTAVTTERRWAAGEALRGL